CRREDEHERRSEHGTGACEDERVTGHRILAGERPDDTHRGDDRKEQIVEALIERERLRRLCLLLTRTEGGAPLRGRPEKRLEDEDIDVEHSGERRENEPGDDHGRSRHECFGSYPSRRRALSIDSRVSWSPTA